MDDKKGIKRIINQMIREKGRFPTFLEMCNKLNLNEEQTRKYMNALEEDGYLERQKDWYKFPDESLFEGLSHLIDNKKGIPAGIIKPDDQVNIPEENISEERDVIEEHIESILDGTSSEQSSSPEQREKEKKWFKRLNLKLPKMPKKKKKKLVKTNSQIYGMPVYIVQFMMGIIGSGAAVISVYYTTIWLFEFLPWAFALLLSTIMVGFAIASFETIILLMSGQVTKSNIAKVIMSVGFAMLFVIVSLFSIMSTVAGQYNKYVANLRIETKKGDNSSNASYLLLKEEKSELNIRLSEYRQQVNNLTKILSGMSDVDALSEKSSVWKNTQYRLYLANKEIKVINKKLNLIRDKEQTLITEGKESGSILVGVDTENKIPDFYGWLSGIFLVGRDKIQFIMSLFPAIFVDIISPVGIGLSLFLRNKYK